VRRPLRIVLAAALVLTGCSAVIGVNDIFLAEPGPILGEGGSSEAGTTDAPVVEGGGEGGTCNGDLQVDKKNCGRCGHDCLGGNCTAGKCELVALAGGLAAPTGLAVDATHLYVANSGDGTVMRVPKAGGNVQQLVSGWQNVVGVAVSGTSLFWSSFGVLGDAGDGSFGGVWKCTLPACTDKKVISTVGYARHLHAKNGYVYYANQSEIRRVKDDGTGDMTIAAVNQGFSVAADATHVYYTSNQNSLERSLIGGGGTESVGPLTSTVVGYVSLDSQRFYWAYMDLSNKGQVFGGLKAAPATRNQYGTANAASIAAAGDDVNVYWANEGTFTGPESNGDGELLTCPVAGCTADPVRLAGKLRFGGPIIPEPNVVYFLEYGGRNGANGRVLKVAKP
jgi:hypothetical protein